MFKSSLGRTLAHNSTLPSISSIGGVSSKDLRPLQDLISSSKVLLQSLQKLFGDLSKTSETLRTWGAGEGEDLGHILGAAAALLSIWGEALQGYGTVNIGGVRETMKSLRTKEEELDELKRRRKALQSKADGAEKKLAKMSPEHKNLQMQTELLNQLNDGIKELNATIMQAESNLADLKRTELRRVGQMIFGGLEELGSKAVTCGQGGKAVTNELASVSEQGHGRIDENWMPRPMYPDESRRRVDNIVSDARNAIAQGTVAPSHINAAPFSSFGGPGSPYDLEPPNPAFSQIAPQHTGGSSSISSYPASGGRHTPTLSQNSQNRDFLGTPGPPSGHFASPSELSVSTMNTSATVSQSGFRSGPGSGPGPGHAHSSSTFSFDRDRNQEFSQGSPADEFGVSGPPAAGGAPVGGRFATFPVNPAARGVSLRDDGPMSRDGSSFKKADLPPVPEPLGFADSIHAALGLDPVGPSNRDNDEDAELLANPNRASIQVSTDTHETSGGLTDLGTASEENEDYVPPPRMRALNYSDGSGNSMGMGGGMTGSYGPPSPTNLAGYTHATGGAGYAPPPPAAGYGQPSTPQQQHYGPGLGMQSQENRVENGPEPVDVLEHSPSIAAPTTTKSTRKPPPKFPSEDDGEESEEADGGLYSYMTGQIESPMPSPGPMKQNFNDDDIHPGHLSRHVHFPTRQSTMAVDIDREMEKREQRVPTPPPPKQLLSPEEEERALNLAAAREVSRELDALSFTSFGGSANSPSQAPFGNAQTNTNTPGWNSNTHSPSQSYSNSNPNSATTSHSPSQSQSYSPSQPHVGPSPSFTHSPSHSYSNSFGRGTSPLPSPPDVNRAPSPLMPPQAPFGRRAVSPSPSFDPGVPQPPSGPIPPYAQPQHKTSGSWSSWRSGGPPSPGGLGRDSAPAPAPITQQETPYINLPRQRSQERERSRSRERGGEPTSGLSPRLGLGVGPFNKSSSSVNSVGPPVSPGASAPPPGAKTISAAAFRRPPPRLGSSGGIPSSPYPPSRLASGGPPPARQDSLPAPSQPFAGRMRSGSGSSMGMSRSPPSSSSVRTSAVDPDDDYDYLSAYVSDGRDSRAFPDPAQSGSPPQVDFGSLGNVRVANGYSPGGGGGYR